MLVLQETLRSDAVAEADRRDPQGQRPNHGIQPPAGPLVTQIIKL